MDAQKPYHAGHDIKSLLMNWTSVLVLLLPFVLYFAYEHVQNYLMVLAGSFLLAILAPPFGGRRPHPYSDDPTNTPFTLRKSD